MNRLRFLSFNIHGGRSRDGRRDLTRIHALMERFDIDIGVFQEVETRINHGGNAADVDHLAGSTRPHRLASISIETDYGWFGNLIVSRYPILRGLAHNLDTAPYLEPRTAVDALIGTPWGNLRVIGTHLSLSLIERHAEARNLIRLIQSVEEEERSPILLMGDINEWQWPSRLLRYLNSILTPIPCRGTFPSWLPVLRLDRVWHDAPGLKLTAHRVSGRHVNRLSDHLPLLVEVEFGM